MNYELRGRIADRKCEVRNGFPDLSIPPLEYGVNAGLKLRAGQSYSSA